MPYIAEPDEETIRKVRNALLAVALRHADTGEDAFMRLPRTKLYDLTGLDVRREDFYAAVRFLAEETDAVREMTGTGRRADVALDRIVDEVGEWETVLYDDFPDDEPEPEQVAALIGGVSPEPIPTDLLIKRKPRTPVVHDPEAPRKCARCGETKPTTEFGRRSADPEHPDHHRFQSYCRACATAHHRSYAYNDPRRQRPERWKEDVEDNKGRPTNGRTGGRHPNAAPYHGYFKQFTTP